ncbi:hypothetical protein FHX37_4373 [Haloactinospora alba]|uniref:Uncharacterized protein n=1 Tax=Haloactinospora alba TaxID=405555 RepID=A0A543N737_9ACTN|nr:hypothetical protein [Haloactinospora alba]TQN27649.1 hypothetical protein FHX37_4373 [Haloactinospora alba]
MFCGDPLSAGYEKCTDQMALFALASMIPAALALALMVTAFTAPSTRRSPALRTQTLGFSLLAWGIAGATYIMGGLPSF